VKEITVAVIGSGSTYCPELVDGFLKVQESLKLRRIAFMDIDERKRNIVGGLCLRMLQNAGVECEAVLTGDLDEALRGADFVVTQIRVGKLPARHLDETIPLKYGLIGQETTGIGGFFKALRTIPVLGHICERMEAICPDAWLINFTNPSGIVTEFILNYTKVKCIGLCNVPINMLDDTREAAGPDAEITYFGLNHLSWITSVKLDGVNVLPGLLRDGVPTKVMENIQDDGFSLECLRAISAVPSSYLQYYYGRGAKLRHQAEDEKSRAQVCMEIEEQLLEMYQDKELREKPALLDKRGGHKYSLAAVALIDAIANDKQDVQVVNILNKGTLPFLEANDSVEVAAVIGKDGAAPLTIDPAEVHPHMVALMRIVKAYERFTVEAAVTGSEDAAMNALLVHPLVGDWEKAHPCFQEMKEAHREYLSAFFPQDAEE
jgi:6-phospho-beta-glucosidase